VPGSDAQSQLFERRQWIRSTLLIHDGTGWLPMPVCSLEEVDEIDPEGLFSLAHLPLLTFTVAFQLLAEPADLVRQGLVRGGARQESQLVREKAAAYCVRWLEREVALPPPVVDSPPPQSAASFHRLCLAATDR
jgi:hypothetical protein